MKQETQSERTDREVWALMRQADAAKPKLTGNGLRIITAQGIREPTQAEIIAWASKGYP